jgi:ABC-type glutathione transport system ATPase component
VAAGLRSARVRGFGSSSSSSSSSSGDEEASTSGRGDMSTLIIAHRLSTVRRADRIVVVAAGRVAEAGTHEELLSSPAGLYRRLVATAERSGSFDGEQHQQLRPHAAGGPQEDRGAVLV